MFVLDFVIIFFGVGVLVRVVDLGGVYLSVVEFFLDDFLVKGVFGNNSIL